MGRYWKAARTGNYVSSWHKRMVQLIARSTVIVSDFNLHMQARLEAIHVPINMKNLQSASYCRTLWQRAVQSERHARGVVDFAYACKQVSCLPRINWATILLMLKVSAV